VGFVEALRRHYRRGGAARYALAIPAAMRRRWLAREGKAAQTLISNLSTKIVGDVVIDVCEFAGQFACSARSDLFARIALSGTYEPELAQLFRAHITSDRDIIDVGANIGFYTVLAAKLNPARRTLAIEPNPDAQRRLTENLQRNGVAQSVTVFPGLASNHSGEGQLNLIDGMEEYSSVGEIAHAAVASKATRQITVEAATLDQLVERLGLCPGLIKIDVEGAEGLVFGGAIETVRKFKPVILSEFSPALLRKVGTNPLVLLANLRSSGYRVIDTQDPTIDPVQRDYGDILCLPI